MTKTVTAREPGVPSCAVALLLQVSTTRHYVIELRSKLAYQLKRNANWIWRGLCADLILPKSGLISPPSVLIALIGLE
jgi:hypothetical protein